jgi:hypothetical protein
MEDLDRAAARQTHTQYVVLQPQQYLSVLLGAWAARRHQERRQKRRPRAGQRLAPCGISLRGTYFYLPVTGDLLDRDAAWVDLRVLDEAYAPGASFPPRSPAAAAAAQDGQEEEAYCKRIKQGHRGELASGPEERVGLGDAGKVELGERVVDANCTCLAQREGAAGHAAGLFEDEAFVDLHDRHDRQLQVGLPLHSRAVRMWNQSETYSESRASGASDEWMGRPEFDARLKHFWTQTHSRCEVFAHAAHERKWAQPH